MTAEETVDWLASLSSDTLDLLALETCVRWATVKTGSNSHPPCVRWATGSNVYRTQMSGKGRESWGSMRTGARLPSTMNPSLCVSLLSVGVFDVVEDFHSDPRGAYRVVSSHHSQIHKKKLKPAQINKEQQLGSVCVDGRPRKQTQNKT